MKCDFNHNGRTIPCTIIRREKRAEIDGYTIHGDDYGMIFGPGGEDIRGATKRELREEILPRLYALFFIEE